MNGGIDEHTDMGYENPDKPKDEKLRGLKEIEDVLFKALNTPGKLRLRLIKWLFPEMIVVAKKLQDFYWK
ncbi:hypothetical protein LCGC14_2442150 [marine sediment metagenome]|uniref:Uncharacterized protein n=1 Tax=marine sediment metagenome TaxID=412755 RepID=A0A0F9C648_9ZZZZ